MTSPDAEFAQCVLDGIGKVFGVAGTHFLGRSAMPRQIQCDDAPSFGQRGLGEHPGIEVGAEAVHEHNRCGVAVAEIQDAQPPAARFDVMRGRAGFLRGGFGNRFRRREIGDKRVDLGIRHAVGGRDRE